MSKTELGPITVPKASDVVAAELRERILTGQFAAGSALPPERQLSEQTGMSRATVREALRILEVQGLVRIRIGRTGGAFVREPGSDGLVQSVELLVRGRKVRMSALLETREAIEPTCASLAATRHDAVDGARLEEANDALAAATSDLPAFLAANVRWHVAVAEASHNELLGAFMHALSRTLYTSTDNAEFVDGAVRSATIRAHRGVTEAIRDGDAALAARRMGSHVRTYADAVLQVERRHDIALADAGRRRPTRRRG